MGDVLCGRCAGGNSQSTSSKLPAPVQLEDETTLPAIDVSIITPLSLDQITPEIRLLASRCILASDDAGGAFSRDAHKYAAYTIIRERQLKTVLSRESATTARYDAKIEDLEAEVREVRLGNLAMACECRTEEACAYLKRAELAEAERDALKAERDVLAKKLAVIFDEGCYSDSLGVHGSDFTVCRWCDGGSVPGGNPGFKHNDGCLLDDTALEEKVHAACDEKLRTLKSQLDAMTVDRNLWQEAHDEDCPNKAQLDAVVGHEAPQDAWQRAYGAALKKCQELTDPQFGQAPISLICVGIAPYTPPLKAGR